jgi:Na+/melibiose symporter-like transporter
MRHDDASGRPRRRRGGRIIYWLAVTMISLVLVVGLLFLLQSCDESTVSAATAAQR